MTKQSKCTVENCSICRLVDEARKAPANPSPGSERPGKRSSDEAADRQVLLGRITTAVMRVVDAARAEARAEERDASTAADPERKELKLARTHLFKLIKEYGRG